MLIQLPTTEDGVWIRLPFKIRKEDRNLTKRQAQRMAILYRCAGRLARVVNDGGKRWSVATYKPRRYAPMPRDLVIH